MCKANTRKRRRNLGKDCSPYETMACTQGDRQEKSLPEQRKAFHPFFSPATPPLEVPKLSELGEQHQLHQPNTSKPNLSQRISNRKGCRAWKMSPCLCRLPPPPNSECDKGGDQDSRHRSCKPDQEGEFRAGLTQSRRQWNEGALLLWQQHTFPSQA